MSDFCKFNDIYDRLGILSEAKASVSRDFPGLKPAWKKAASQARQAGASAPTREAKMTILRIIVSLVEARVGRELTVEEERSIMKFRNIAAQQPLIDFLKAQEIDGQPYASIIGNSTERDIEEASKQSGIADDIDFQIGQRSEKRKEAYKDRAAAREEAKKLADVADNEGDAELGNSLDEIGDYIVKFAKGVTETESEALPFDDLDITIQPGIEDKDAVVAKLIEIMSDAGYTAEATPAGLNAEAPVGTFGSQDKAEDLVKGLIMKLFPNVREDQVEVLLNTDAAVEDGETHQSPYGPSDEDIMDMAERIGVGSEEFILDGEGGLVNRDEVLTMIKGAEDGESMSFNDEIRGKLKPGVPVSVGDEGSYYTVESVNGDKVIVKDDDGIKYEFSIHDINDVYEGAEDGEYADVVTESYTSQYVVGLPQKSEDKVESIVESVSFKEKFKPKTSEQLAELRRYGL
jgi:hypothetical protein